MVSILNNSGQNLNYFVLKRDLRSWSLGKLRSKRARDRARPRTDRDYLLANALYLNEAIIRFFSLSPI